MPCKKRKKPTPKKQEVSSEDIIAVLGPATQEAGLMPVVEHNMFMQLAGTPEDQLPICPESLDIIKKKEKERENAPPHPLDLLLKKSMEIQVGIGELKDTNFGDKP